MNNKNYTFSNTTPEILGRRGYVLPSEFEIIGVSTVLCQKSKLWTTDNAEF